MPNTENRKNSNKKPTLQEHSQTVIIPQLTPEMLEQARRAAEQGKTAEQIEQEALAAAQAEQKAVESKQEAPTAEKPKTVQPANKPKTRKEAEEELAQNIHDDHLWLNNPVMVRGLGLAPIVAAAVSGQNAWMLCAATILLVTATRMLAVAICHLTGNRFRGVVYSYAAAIVYRLGRNTASSAAFSASSSFRFSLSSIIQPLRFLISCRIDFIRLLAALISRFRFPMLV